MIKLIIKDTFGTILTILICVLMATAEPVQLAEQIQPVIYAIEIIGNQVTSKDFILREMELTPGMIITPKLVEDDRLRLESLGLFNRVDIKTVSDNGRAVLVVTVTEPWYVYLFPVVRWDPSEPDKKLIGAGIYHRNFRGFGEQVGVYGWGGYEEGIFIVHEDPWFRFGGKYGVDGRLSWRDQELVEDNGDVHRLETHSAEVTVRRRVNRTARIELGVGWEERISEVDYYTLSPGEDDQLIVLQSRFRNDMRDYRYYPSNGYLFQTILEGNYLIDCERTFFRENIELRKYLSLGSFIVAGKLSTTFSQKKMPYYRQIILTKSQIRTDFEIDDFGDMATVANLELRFNLLGLRYYSFDKIPIAGRYLRNLKFSIEGVMFADRGFGRHNDGVLVQHDLWAYGCGLQFQLPYVNIAHVLLGWRPDDSLNSPTLMLRDGVTF